MRELIALAADAHSPALIDLSAVTFLDASGLSALITARRSVEGTDVTLVLLNPSLRCRRVLEITRVDEIFEIIDCNPRR